MTVSVTRPDGEVDKYMRFGDAFVKHADGTLHVMRTGAKTPFSYARGEWADVAGDERRGKRRLW